MDKSPGREKLAWNMPQNQQQAKLPLEPNILSPTTNCTTNNITDGRTRPTKNSADSRGQDDDTNTTEKKQTKTEKNNHHHTQENSKHSQKMPKVYTRKHMVCSQQTEEEKQNKKQTRNKGKFLSQKKQKEQPKRPQGEWSRWNHQKHHRRKQQKGIGRRRLKDQTRMKVETRKI